MTIAAGLWGAFRQLLIFALGLTLIVSAPFALTRLAQRGVIDLNAIVPRSAAPLSQSVSFCIESTARQKAAARQALDDLVWPVDTSGIKVVVTNPRNLPQDSAGMYVFPDNTIYVSQYVLEADPSGHRFGHVVAHEIGHMFDRIYLDAEGRQEFSQLRGFARGTSWQDGSTPWGDRPAEDFAEVYAAFDGPSSRVPIQTNRGDVSHASEIRALIERYQPGPNEPTTSLRVATALTLAREASVSMQTDPDVSLVLVGVATVAAIVGAVYSIEEAPYKARQRQLRAARVHIHHAGLHGA